MFSEHQPRTCGALILCYISRPLPAMNLFDQIFQSERAARPALLFEERSITYQQLSDETVRVAGVLKSLGVAQGDRVAILLSDSPEFVSSFIAIFSIGAIAVPVNLALRSEDQLFILKDCGARLAIVEAQRAMALFLNSSSRTKPIDLIVVRRSDQNLPELPGIEVHDFANADRESFDEFPLTIDTDADAFILYTSGSTGEPKGAVHTQADIFYTNETYGLEVLKLGEDDRLFSSSRLPFAYGLGNSFTFPLLNGRTAILCREKPAPEVISRIFTEYRPTIFFGVPVVYRMLLEYHRKLRPLDCSSLRLCISAGEALPQQLGQDWEGTFSVAVLDAIGSTEMLHMFLSNREGEVRYGSSGKLLRGYEARLVDHEGVTTPLGEVGNLWVHGRSAAKRYWERPEISATTFVDGWVRTGDLYRCDADGFWWHMGRSDDCFKSGAQWVSPIEVEGVLVRSEQINAAAVVEGFDEDGLACVCAFVVCADELESTETVEQSLRAQCERALARFKRPRRYLFVSELPYTATGKVQRFKLREQLRAQSRR